MTDRKQLRRVIKLGIRDFESADEVQGRQAARIKMGIDVRFHKSRDRDRKRLIPITASRRPDAAIKEEAISPSAASAKPASGHNESHNGAGGHDDASAIPSTRPCPRTMSEAPAQTADAGEAEKSDLPKVFRPSVTPHAADAANAGIKYGDLQVPVRSFNSSHLALRNGWSANI